MPDAVPIDEVLLQEATRLRAEADKVATPAMRDRLLRMADDRMRAAAERSPPQPMEPMRVSYDTHEARRDWPPKRRRPGGDH
jgi:hypothetical protein